MRFPIVFSRLKASVGTTLGTDVLPLDGDGNPTPGNTSINDNYITSRLSNINGWPVYRIAVVCQYIGSGSLTGITLPATMFFFEQNLGIWCQVAASATNITPAKIGTTSGPIPVFYDIITPIDLPHVTSDLGSVDPGNIGALLIVSDNSAPNGTYKFAMSVDITAKPF